MDQRNNNNRPNNMARTAATVAIGAAVGYGVYKLFESMFGSSESETNHRMLSDNNMEIYVVDTIDKLRNSLKKLKLHCSEYNVLGFDCEWESRPREGRQKVAMLQLCTHRGFCVVIRLSKFRYISPELAAILEDVNILKVGNTPDKDANYLRDDYGVHVASTLDLRFMAREAECAPGKLEKMSREYLGLELDKRYQTSEWEAYDLSEEEIDYAAKDAFAGIELFKYFTGKIAPGKSVKYIIENYCLEYIDKEYR